MGKFQSVVEIIDNDNVEFQRNNPMTMSMSKRRIYGLREKKLDESEVDPLVDELVDRFNAKESRGFYADCVRYLTRAYIGEACALARQPGIINQAAFFGRLCYSKLKRAGIYPKRRPNKA